MADWQERVQSLILGFVFGFMVVKLFSVISSFRAGNLRVTRVSDEDDDDVLLVPSELEVSAPLIGTDEETEADGGDELEDRANGGSSSSSSDSEAAHSRDIGDEPTVSEVESKDVGTTKEKEVEAKETKDFTAPGDSSLKALTTDDGPS